MYFVIFSDDCDAGIWIIYTQWLYISIKTEDAYKHMMEMATE